MISNKIVSPCISICKNDDSGYCYGCARNIKEKKIWKYEGTSNGWKKINLKEITKRMNSIQLETFKESYNHKINYGISLEKKRKIKKNNS